MYVLTTQEVYTHIPKHKWVHIYRFAWKANDSRGIHVYFKVWQNKHIHEMKHIIIKQIQKWEYKSKMYESSKLDYTNTSNEYKQAFKHKHI